MRKCWLHKLEFLPPPSHDVVDPSKVTHTFLPKQGEIDRLINQINKKVLRDGTFTDYYERLRKNLKYMEERLQKFRSQRLDMLNRNRQQHVFEIGQIVYMYQARGGMVQTGNRKIACCFVGPLVIYQGSRAKSVSSYVIRWTDLSPSYRRDKT